MDTQIAPESRTALAEPSTGSARPSPDPAPRHSRGPMLLVAAAVIAVVAMLVIGIIPRLKQGAVLAEGVKQAKSSLLEVTLTKPRWVAAPAISLPGNVQAIKETTINARATGYLRDLYVD